MGTWSTKLVVLTMLFSLTLFHVDVECKVFTLCGLRDELIKQRFDRTFLPQWACLADSESGRDTSKVGVGPAGSQKYGIFQIDSQTYCQKGRKGGICNAKCEDFLLDDITASAQCAKIIFQRDGFKYWNKWVKSCKTRDLTNFLTHCPPVARSVIEML